MSVGDSKLDLLGKCGKPTLEEQLQEERSTVVVSADPRIASGRRATVSSEKWTYNFGPTQFVQYVTIEGGKIAAIEQGNYGYNMGQAPKDPKLIPLTRCDADGFHVGDSTFDLLARCGEPASKDTRVETRLAMGPGGTKAATAPSAQKVTVDVWTYDFGPQAFVRVLDITDGKVTKIEMGGYGHAR